MNEDLPPNLRRMLDDLPVGQPRLGELLTTRRAQRQRRRWAVMGTATATVAIVAGGFAVAQVGGDGDGGTTGSDPATAPTVSEPPRPTTPEGTTIELPTSTWRQGDAGMEALIHGTLSTDRRGCVVLRHGDGRTNSVIWPADHSAVIDSDGRLYVLGPDGKALARDGDEVSMGGGYLPAGDNQHPCVRGKKEVAWVQDTVTVTEPGPDRPLPDLPEPTGASDDRAYEKWLDRAALTDCGTQWFTLGFGGDAPMVDFNHARCLRDAAAQGTGGEAIERFTTVEGDPITRYLRVLPTGDVEVFTDSTLDKFGSGRWHHAACDDVEQALAGGC